MVKFNQAIRAQLFKIISWQFIIVMGLALVIALLQGKKQGYSAGMGGIAYWLPTFIFVWRVSAHASARALTALITAFFAGELIKLVLTVFLFSMAVYYFSADPLYGVLGLMMSIMAFWVSSVVLVCKDGRKS